MAEIVNLRREKKRRAKSAAAAEAEQNRLVHGRTNAQKSLDRLTAKRQEATLSGHFLETPATDAIPE